jgi:hypothetical protein
MFQISSGRLVRPDLSSYPLAPAYNLVPKSQPLGALVTDGLVYSIDGNNPLCCVEPGTVNDLSGNNSLLTRLGSPSLLFNPGRFNFNTINNYYTQRATNMLPTGNSPFTIEVWVRLTTSSGGSQYVWVSGGSNTGIVYGILCTSTSWFCYTGPAGGTSATNTNRPLNVWTHVVGTRDASGLLRCYVNTVLGANTNSQAGSIIVGTPWIAANPNSLSERFIGDIGMVKIYNRALSADEVSRNYMITRPLYKV